jgi:hypothetical protein
MVVTMVNLLELNPNLDNCEQYCELVFVYIISIEACDISSKMTTRDMKDVWTLADIVLPSCFPYGDSNYLSFVHHGYTWDIDKEVKGLEKKLGNDFSPSNFFIYSYERLESFEDMSRRDGLFNLFDKQKYILDPDAEQRLYVTNERYWKKESHTKPDIAIENDDLFINTFSEKQAFSDLNFVYNYLTEYVDENFKKLQSKGWMLENSKNIFNRPEYSLTKFKGSLRDAIDQTVNIIGCDRWHSLEEFSDVPYFSPHTPKDVFFVSVLVNITPLSKLLSKESLQTFFNDKKNFRLHEISKDDFVNEKPQISIGSNVDAFLDE